MMVGRKKSEVVAPNQWTQPLNISTKALRIIIIMVIHAYTVIMHKVCQTKQIKDTFISIKRKLLINLNSSLEISIEDGLFLGKLCRCILLATYRKMWMIDMVCVWGARNQRRKGFRQPKNNNLITTYFFS